MIFPVGSTQAGKVDPGAGLRASQLFNDLEGVWDLSRSITGVGLVTGSAAFRALNGGTLSYREEVEVSNADGHRVRAYREYLYERLDDAVVVRFTDNKVFLTLRPTAADGALVAEDQHPCGADVYVVRYRHASRVLQIDIDVRGPTENYDIRTTLRKRTARPGR